MIDGTMDGTIEKDEVKKDVLELLSESDNPISTKDISDKLERPWHSIQTRCLQLQIEGLINGFKIGRMNLWQIKESKGERKNE